MPKPRKTLRIPLLPYLAPRLAWRKGLLRAVRRAKRARRITYDESDRLALNILLYLVGRNLDRIDVDNRLKRTGPERPAAHHDRWADAKERYSWSRRRSYSACAPIQN